MKTLNIPLKERSYPIYIGEGLLDKADLFSAHIGAGQKMVVISNEVVAPLYLEKTLASLAGLGDVETVVLPDGEHTKTLQTANEVFTEMLQVPCDRKTTVIALGGGVTGDLSGFCAACYQRGVPFIQVPTTLLSQVDSSVGGKTGVNHALGKNMVGAFYQPQAVIIDTATLDSLDDRQFSAGMAEVVKYGLLGDLPFLEWIEQNINAIMCRDKQAIAQIIERSCQAKADIVAKDEKEHGVRALLNLGHTFGHAIESAKGYGEWLHGEAVGLGMVMAADLSRRLGYIKPEDQQRVQSIVAAAKLPVDGVQGVSAEQLRELMAVDKKVADGKLRFILYKQIGQAIIVDDVPELQLMQTLSSFAHQ